jgi:D-alanyl-D-alanine carboxypeptidase (penicillin-binding protein 5/6)
MNRPPKPHPSPRRRTLAALGLLLAAVLAAALSCAPSEPAPPPVRLPEVATAAHAAPPPPASGAFAAADGAAESLVAESPVAEQIGAPPFRAPMATPTVPPPALVREVEPPRISADMAVVIDEASGSILYGRNEHQEVPPASLTKIVTAMVALDRSSPTARVSTDVDSRVMWDSTVMGLVPGEEVSMEDLLYGIMLPSGNDAAIAIARHIAGTEAAFAELMNAKVRELGLQHTRFVNSHGLEEPGHYSSAYDMAMLSRAAMRRPYFRRLAVAKEWNASGLLRSYRLVNLNRLLWQYPGADGVKIGYEDTAINTMVVSAVRDGHRIYASFMRSTRRDADGTALLNYAFDAYAWPSR